eukprot:TRINITY_DN17775_c0_g2_i1.p1 TRINITY_DN17775_c0_g2~~TRINITY_DN17775_c0_g2_i1.p1  ORF type:complete len:401 (-),score=46.01 TRINITY_DN17775_c0_g2_i1:333-1535(-)
MRVLLHGFGQLQILSSLGLVLQFSIRNGSCHRVRESAPSPSMKDYLAAARAAGLDVGEEDPWTQIMLEGYEDAKCLDGTSGSLFLRDGSESAKNKFLIYFECGSFCSTHEDCAVRAKSYLGSTSPKYPNNTRLNRPALDTSNETNPLMWDWNHVYVRYCDGAYYSGERRDPVTVGEMTIYYRGRYILNAAFDYLKKHVGLNNATDVVLSGCSAGAIHVFAHLDAMREMLPVSATVVGFPDSGFYIDKPMFTRLKKFVIEEQKATGMLSKTCLEDMHCAPWKCLLSSKSWKYLQTPLFAWQSRYDLDHLEYEMDVTCSKDDDCVNLYGKEIEKEMLDMVTQNKKIGMFLDSCNRHCQRGAHALPTSDPGHITPMEAFKEWYETGKGVYVQRAKYPCCACCS